MLGAAGTSMKLGTWRRSGGIFREGPREVRDGPEGRLWPWVSAAISVGVSSFLRVPFCQFELPQGVEPAPQG